MNFLPTFRCFLADMQRRPMPNTIPIDARACSDAAKALRRLEPRRRRPWACDVVSPRTAECAFVVCYFFLPRFFFFFFFTPSQCQSHSFRLLILFIFSFFVYLVFFFCFFLVFFFFYLWILWHTGVSRVKACCATLAPVDCRCSHRAVR